MIESSPETAIRTIASYIGAAPDSTMFSRLAERYEKGTLKGRFDGLENDSSAVDIGFSYYDKQTFFHRRHITSSKDGTVERDLTCDQRQWIREALAATP